MMRRVRGGVALALAVAGTACALGPHEVLLLVNPASPESRTIANRYIELRGIPEENVVFLAPPASACRPEATISPREFSATIWNPAQETMRRRGLSPHIRAWVFSAGFPSRISTSPAISIQGAVFARNELPPADMVMTGLYRSVLFRGPVGENAMAAETVSFENAASALGWNMPMPAMALAWTGARGLTLEESLSVLDRGVAADATRPTGPVYLLRGPDVRARCRAWQFEAAAAEFQRAGGSVRITDRFPENAQGVMGLMAGVSEAAPSSVAGWTPGAYADHLTSLAAEWQVPKQTKLTEWLRAGASCSAGTVTEPYALWPKFPHARIYAHLAAGATMLEALTESVASPMQLFAVGDPLSRPWGIKATGAEVQIAGPDAIRGAAVFTAEVPAGFNAKKWMFLLDGRMVKTSPDAAVELSTSGLSAGFHQLRAVAYSEGGMCQQLWGERTVRVESVPGRTVELRRVENSAAHAAHRPLSFSAKADAAATAVALFHLGQKIVETAGPEAHWTLLPSVLGEGTVAVQAVALYADGTMVRGEPLRFRVARSPQTPVFRVAQEPSAPLTWKLMADDSGSAPISLCAQWPAWRRSWRGTRLSADAVVAGGQAVLERDSLSLEPGETDPRTTCIWAASDAPIWRAKMTLAPGKDGVPRAGGAYLVWNCAANGDFDFFGMNGESSAWEWGEYRGGRWIARESVGAPLRCGVAYDVAVSRSPDGKMIECRVGRDSVFRAPAPAGLVGLGRTGVAGNISNTSFRELRRAELISPGLESGAAVVWKSPVRRAGLEFYADNGEASRVVEAEP